MSSRDELQRSACVGLARVSRKEEGGHLSAPEVTAERRGAGQWPYRRKKEGEKDVLLFPHKRGTLKAVSAPAGT